MEAVGGRERPGPFAGRGLGEPPREVVPERRGHVSRAGRVASPPGASWRRRARRPEPPEPAARSRARSCSASARASFPRSAAQKTCRKEILGSPPNASGCAFSHASISASVGGAGRRLVAGEELELLPEALADDGVVAVEAEGHRLPRRDLLLDVLVDQPLQLVLGRRARPGLRVAGGEVQDLAGGHDDPVRARTRRSALPLEPEEEQPAEEQEVDEGLAEDLLHARAASRESFSSGCTRWATCSRAR